MDKSPLEDYGKYKRQLPTQRLLSTLYNYQLWLIQGVLDY